MTENLSGQFVCKSSGLVDASSSNDPVSTVRKQSLFPASVSNSGCSETLEVLIEGAQLNVNVVDAY